MKAEDLTRDIQKEKFKYGLIIEFLIGGFKMKKILTIFMAFLLIIGLSPVYAQELDADQIEEQGGLTPDSALYRLDRAAEKLSLLLTFGKTAKAKKGLDHAMERVLEAKTLIKKGKVEKLEELKEEHRKSVEKVKENLEKIKERDSEKALEDVLEVELKLEEQANELEKVETELDLKVVGKLNDEQLEKLKSLLESLNIDVSEVKIKVREGKEELKIRVKKEKQKTDEEIKQLEEKFKVREVKKENAEQAVERLAQKLEKLTEIANKHKERGRDVSEIEVRLNEVREILEKLKTQISNNELDSVKDLIQKADQLLNFREVFRALENEDENKLRELKREKELKKKELESRLKELEKRRAEKLSKEAEKALERAEELEEDEDREEENKPERGVKAESERTEN